MGYIKPVSYTGISSHRAHTRRVPPSQEAGVDYYCPIGTPVVAPAAGRVVAVGGGTGPATGRFVTIDLDDGRRVRFLHLSAWRTSVGDEVDGGDLIGLSGASGYGSEYFGASSPSRIPANTGGPHVHVTLWPRHAYSFGVNAGTLDFDAYADNNAPALGGGGSEEDMPSEEWLIKLGADIVSQVTDQVRGVKADVATVHNTVIQGHGSLSSAVAAIRADVNYIHTLSPYSLKAILEASRAGEITLTDAQTKAIGGQLAAASVAGIDAALRDDFDGVKALLKRLPQETIAALKSAL